MHGKTGIYGARLVMYSKQASGPPKTFGASDAAMVDEKRKMLERTVCKTDISLDMNVE